MSTSAPMDRTGHPTFIFVIDGEVVEIQAFEPGAFNDGRIAALSSDPKIYILPGGYPADPKTLPLIGSTYIPE